MPGASRCGSLRRWTHLRADAHALLGYYYLLAVKHGEAIAAGHHAHGRADEARREAQEVLRHEPGFRLSALEGRLAIVKDHELVARILMYFDEPMITAPVYVQPLGVRLLMSTNGLALLALGILPQPLMALCLIAIKSL